MVSKQNAQGQDQASRWDSLPSYDGVCFRYWLQVDTCKIGVINAILESYGPLTLLRTQDIKRGILEIVVPQDWENVFLQAIGQLKKSLNLTMLDSYPEENSVNE